MLKFFFKEDPKELVRKWQATLRAEQRGLDRQVRDIQFEEKKVHKAIREAAKRGDMGSAKHLAKEIIQSRKAVARLYTNKAHLQSLNTALMEQLAMLRVAGTLSKSTEVMKAVNTVIKAPELQKTMMEMSKEMMKVGLIEEMISDAIDGALGAEDEEEETEEEVQKVLDEIAVETRAALPDARRAARERQQAAAAEEGDDMEELRARLDAVKA
ncbi:hypothetical protein VOLCADRAFT_102242 [Volvox carteri f. nagariensis]|uniref:Uncharacterized protein n=1 Tax=Volvox carteri f. nagariensis TaxID=3068 RepID=D8U8U3_VOLCA|nr:uncharacterized protein VOLCADRAFT_102242 [Volvox carteri f. nagariensis]EFJ43867.1 hypothetical protein VOLCADRAFT_102242 [Volvox carteri f. nagariensis]|eukprot:XP_002955113.1 hypothetical protein VOLCADRAFT_102242 [Volvox carteri f. nagariensis]